MSIREARVAGTFYPEKKEHLQQTLQNFRDCKKQDDIKDISCIIAPHAGYIYSGKIAASAYQYIHNKKFDKVLVISPSHHDYFTGCTTITDNYVTPLGEIKTDSEFIEKLTGLSRIVSVSNMGHGPEHALEVHLPFLQETLDEFKLIPLVMGRQNMETARILAEDLFEVIKSSNGQNKLLIVCSSDLSHFYEVEHARELDGVIKEDIKAFDPEKFNSDIINKKGEACGHGPILTGMILSRMLGANQSKVIDYGTSGDVNMDFNSVVGYLSAIIYKN